MNVHLPIGLTQLIQRRPYNLNQSRRFILPFPSESVKPVDRLAAPFLRRAYVKKRGRQEDKKAGSMGDKVESGGAV